MTDTVIHIPDPHRPLKYGTIIKGENGLQDSIVSYMGIIVSLKVHEWLHQHFGDNSEEHF